MINRVPLFISLMLFVATAYGLFFIKEKVVYMKSELHEVKKQIKYERNSIHILRAEFAYLSSPKRLAKLNDNYLQLRTTDTKQIVSAFGVEAITEVDKRSKNRMLAASASVSNVKWRYKKGPEKYITRVAGKR